jgi:hypothetical protein
VLVLEGVHVRGDNTDGTYGTNGTYGSVT